MQVAPPVSTRVYIDPPVFGQINPPAPTGRKAVYEHHEITAICRELRDAGYDSRAIVVKRRLYANGMPADFDMAQPRNWGFVTELQTYAPHLQAYVPIKVKWVDGSESKHWPEELFLLYWATTQTELSSRFKRQLEDDPPV